MITKTDCMSLLVKLEDKGIDVNPYMKKLIVSKEIPLDVLRFIADNRGIEIINFYEMLRHSYNKKKSPLYKNILQEVETPEDTIILLSCLLTQIILYGNKLENKGSFLKEARAEEITRVLNTYFKDNNIGEGLALLKLIKSDLLVLEYIAGRRELQ